MKKIGIVIELIVLFIFVSVILTFNVLASHNTEEVRRLCLEEDQSIPSERNPRFTCESDLCVVCVDRRGNIIDLNKCDDVPECSPIQDLDFSDTTAPQLTIFQPINKKVYNDGRIELHVETDEFADIELIDSGKFGSKRRILCNDCVIFRNFVSFSEGFHSISIVATDRSGNLNIRRAEFFVDSQLPRIIKVEPRRNFANGEFKIQFREDNPVLVNFFYGNTLGDIKNLELNPSECTFLQRKHDCNIEVDLSAFDGSGLEFWFAVEDVAGQQAVSKIMRTAVDSTPPIFKDISYDLFGRSVTLKVEIDEDNFHFLEYLNKGSRNARWARLCSRLGADDSCRKRISLIGKGVHEIVLRAWDKAGNSAEESIFIEN